MPSSAPVDGVSNNGQRKQISTLLYGVQSTAFCLQMIKCFFQNCNVPYRELHVCVPNVSNGCPSMKTHWRNTGDTRYD
jgi:hypothetical protein